MSADTGLEQEGDVCLRPVSSLGRGGWALGSSCQGRPRGFCLGVLGGLPDAAMPDTCALTHRPSLATGPAPNSHPRSEGPEASPAATRPQSASPQALSPATRSAPPAPRSAGSISRVSAPPQAGRKASAAPSGAVGAGAGSRLKLEAPRAEGKGPHVTGGAGVTAPRLSPCVAAALLPGLRFAVAQSGSRGPAWGCVTLCHHHLPAGRPVARPLPRRCSLVTAPGRGGAGAHACCPPALPRSVEPPLLRGLPPLSVCVCRHCPVLATVAPCSEGPALGPGLFWALSEELRRWSFRALGCLGAPVVSLSWQRAARRPFFPLFPVAGPPAWRPLSPAPRRPAGRHCPTHSWSASLGLTAVPLPVWQQGTLGPREGQ